MLPEVRGLLSCLKRSTRFVSLLCPSLKAAEAARSYHRCGNDMSLAIVMTPWTSSSCARDWIWRQSTGILFPVFIKCSLFSTESSNTVCVLFTVGYIKDSVFPFLKSLKNRPYSCFSEDFVLPVSKETKMAF